MVPSGESATPLMSAPSGTGKCSGVRVWTGEAPGLIRSRYQVRGWVADKKGVPEASSTESSTNVRSSAAPVSPAKVLPAGGEMVARRWPVSVSPTITESGFGAFAGPLCPGDIGPMISRPLMATK